MSPGDVPELPKPVCQERARSEGDRVTLKFLHKSNAIEFLQEFLRPSFQRCLSASASS